MTKRIAEAADKDDAKAFDRIRSRFIEACAEHLDQGRAISAVAAMPDHYFATMMEPSVIARRDDRPDPFPWFTAFCVRLMDEDDGTREPPTEPTVSVRDARRQSQSGFEVARHDSKTRRPQRKP